MGLSGLRLPSVRLNSSTLGFSSRWPCCSAAEAMNENQTNLRLPASCPLLLRHAELTAALRKADRRARWGRLLRDPLHTLTNRVGLTKLSPLQPDFIAHCGWATQVHRALAKLPPHFITG